MTRRNPQSSNPRRTGGPPPPLDPKALEAQRRAERADYIARRGCPEGTHPEYIAVMRRQGAWWMDEPPP